VREQSLVVEGISAVAKSLPFALRGLDTDNDSALMNEALHGPIVSSTASSGRVHALSQKRSGLGRAKEWRGGAASSRIRATEWANCGRRAAALVRERPALSQLLPAVVQAGEQTARWCTGP